MLVNEQIKMANGRIADCVVDYPGDALCAVVQAVDDAIDAAMDANRVVDIECVDDEIRIHAFSRFADSKGWFIITEQLRDGVWEFYSRMDYSR